MSKTKKKTKKKSENKNKFYTAKYGIIFKNLFCVKPYDNLKELIEKVLERKIGEINSVETEKEEFEHSMKTKNKVMDVYVEFNGGKVNIEINSKMTNVIQKRNYVYFSNMYNTDAQKGEEYTIDKNFYQINLSWGLPKSEPLIRICGVCDLKTAERVIFDLCIYNCNMEKYRKMWYDGSKEEIKKNKFLVALDLPLEDLEEMVKGDAHMEEFKDKMKKLNQNEDI